MNEKKITINIRCSKCGKIVKSSGYPSETKIIRCPKCQTRGFFKFTENEQQKNIEKTNGIVISQLSYILVVIVILASHFVFQTEDFATFLSFLILIPIFVFFQFDGRIPIGYALLMLALSALTLAFNKNESIANQFAIYAYWLLVVGTTCLLIEYLREQRTLKRKKQSG
jgi:phage FluMu protein Com